MMVIGGVVIVFMLGCFALIYKLQQTITNLKRRQNAIEVEIFYPIAEAEIKPGEFKKRITMKGMMDTLVKLNQEKLDYMKCRKPVIHRI
jgi:hypothetical protein